jgi:hypothetical protein
MFNIYRLARLLAPDASPAEREKWIKWVIFAEQWPFRSVWILQQIEDDYQNDRGFKHQPEARLEQVYAQVRERVYAEGAEAYAAIDGDPDLFLRFMAVEPVLSVRDVQRMRRLTFNLNPAIQDQVVKAAARQEGQEGTPASDE